MFVVLAGTLLAGGCGGGGDRPASVSGRVTYNGKSVTSGTVVLLSTDGKASDPAAVQPDGTFSIAKAPAGTVKVVFDNPPPPRVDRRLPANDPEAQAASAGAGRYVLTPPHYKDPTKSGLTLELKSGKNPNSDITLLTQSRQRAAILRAPCVFARRIAASCAFGYPPTPESANTTDAYHLRETRRRQHV